MGYRYTGNIHQLPAHIVPWWQAVDIADNSDTVMLLAHDGAGQALADIAQWLLQPDTAVTHRIKAGVITYRVLAELTGAG